MRSKTIICRSLAIIDSSIQSFIIALSLSLNRCSWSHSPSDIRLPKRCLGHKFWGETGADLAHYDSYRSLCDAKTLDDNCKGPTNLMSFGHSIPYSIAIYLPYFFTVAASFLLSSHIQSDIPWAYPIRGSNWHQKSASIFLDPK